MEEQAEKFRQRSLQICNKLMRELDINQEEARWMFGGEICSAYEMATDNARDQVFKTRSKIGNL